MWGVTITLLVAAATVLLEPSVQLQRAAGELPIERGLARIVFVILLVGMAAAFRGVAEQRVRERTAELRRSRGVLANVLNSIPQSVFWKDTNGAYLGCNQVFARAAGLIDSEDIVGRNDFDMPWRDLAGAYRADDREVIVTGRSKLGIVEPVQHSDGRRPWVSTTKVPLTDETGAVFGVLGVFEDISERKQAEEALRASEERYRRVVETAQEGIMIFDTAWRVSFANARAAQILGYAPDEIVGRPIDDFILDDDRASHEARKAGQLSGLGGTYERAYRTKGGAPVWCLVSATPTLNDGVFAGSFVMLTDISERRRAEETLRQAQKIEAVGRLAGGVAHDFNNLLQALLSQAHLLLHKSHDPVMVEELGRELVQQINRGASLTRQLLLFSRREVARPQWCDLNDIVRHATKMLRRLVRANIGLTSELAPEHLAIEADRGQLEQVLMNLVVNASDAMPAGGSLVIRTAAAERGEVLLAVEDTGHGVPESIRDRIFEPFFTTKDSSKGTGLGLSVVHGIVAQAGGRIEVESTVGTGTVFKVLLPRAGTGAPPAAQEPSMAPEANAGRGERILIVEDEDGAREGLREILTNLGYQAVAVASGEEAGRLPTDPPFDLLLTDLMLPGIAGPELAVGLHERWPELRVILMSGYTEDEAVRQGIRAGQVRFLQKPFDMDTLAREIRATLNEEPAGL